MSVLHVVDRVGVVLLLDLLDIEVDGLVGGAADERIAGGVDAGLVDQLLEADHGAAALGHAHRLAVAQQVDKLAQQDLVLARVAHGVGDGLHALDVAVVVGTPNVDLVIDDLELLPAVGHVGGEVGVLAIALDEHAVLVVAEIGRLEPQGAVLGAIEQALVLEHLEGLVDVGDAGLVGHVEAALAAPLVEVATHLVAGVLDLLEHVLVGALAELGVAHLGGLAHPLVAVGLVEALRDTNDVVAAVGVATQGLVEGVHERVGLGLLVELVLDIGLTVGQQLGGSGGSVDAVGLHDLVDLQVAHSHRLTEDVHLRTVVVNVVLALHVEVGVLEHVAQRVADGGPATVAHVQRTGGVGRDELDLGAQAVAHVDLAPVVARLDDGTEDLVVGSGVEVEVDEAGASDLDLGHRAALGHVRHDGRGDLGGSHVGEACGSHCHRRGPVAVTRISRSLDATVGDLELGQISCGLCSGECLLDKLLDRFGHAQNSLISWVRRTT